MSGNRQPASKPLRPWAGETYYGRPQLKPAPFDPNVVGAYIFLAGLSGSAAILGALTEASTTRRPRREIAAREALVRRSRYLGLLAPTIGSALLVYDLHTPQRFYNMLRVAKKTSPMSIGTWTLMAFSAFAGTAGASQLISDLKPRWRWPRRLATAAQVPAAVAGAGLSTYTAALVSATSAPVWAAAPRATAVRFASSSMAAAAAALRFGERSPTSRRALSNVLISALTAEFIGTYAADYRFKVTGVDAGRKGPWGRTEKHIVATLGVQLPLGLLIASRFRQRPEPLASTAGALAMAGSALFRISMLGVGIESARQPEVSMRFAQPDNLPRVD